MEPSFPKGLRTLRKLDVGLACGLFLRASDVVAVDDFVAVGVVAAALGVDLLEETELILFSGVADERGYKAGHSARDLCVHRIGVVLAAQPLIPPRNSPFRGAGGPAAVTTAAWAEAGRIDLAARTATPASSVMSVPRIKAPSPASGLRLAGVRIVHHTQPPT